MSKHKTRDTRKGMEMKKKPLTIVYNTTSMNDDEIADLFGADPVIYAEWGHISLAYKDCLCHAEQLEVATHYYEAALRAAFPEGAEGAVYALWDSARKAQKK